MMQLGIREVQQELAAAFENGLRLTYGGDLAPLYREVAGYYKGVALDPDQLKHHRDLDTAAALDAIIGNQVRSSTLGSIRSAMISCALLQDRDGLVRWATEGASRAQQMDEPAIKATRPQWEAVLKDPDRFIFMARQIKFFMNQM
jgi:hypothetical protein